jgi:uncharacterized metal-binding protein YceD (DUF177 family)
MSDLEFPRPFDVRQCDGRTVTLTATTDECAALAARMDLVRIDRLVATLALRREAEAVVANGTLSADIVQSCAVSAEDLPVAINEPLVLRFVPAAAIKVTDEEIEIDPNEPDEIDYSGSTIDLGEAVAQSLALAIDPFATGPEAEAARERLRSISDSPFAALAALQRGSGDEADH